MLIKRFFSIFKSKLFMAGIFSICMANSFSAVNVFDEKSVESATFSMDDALGKVAGILKSLADATDFTQQTEDLTKLITAEQQLTDKCNQYCNQEELKKVHDYLEQLNNNFTSQFKTAGDTLRNTSKSLQSIQDIVNEALHTIKNGKVKIAEFSASIQQASLKSQQEIHQILARIQTFSIQQEQKRMMENKLEKANTNSAYAGFHESKL